MREAKCMREVHKQHYACALKIASEQRATDLKPGISWFVAELFPENAKSHLGTFAPEHAHDHSLIHRCVAVEGKERSAPVAN